MLQIDRSGNIKINRGDTFQVPLFIDIGEFLFRSTRFKWHNGDLITFNLLQPNQSFECSILSKDFTYLDLNEQNDIILSFKHEDTINLCPGTYYYEIKLLRKTSDEEGNVKDNYITIVPRRKFIIL